MQRQREADNRLLGGGDVGREHARRVRCDTSQEGRAMEIAAKLLKMGFWCCVHVG